MQNAMILARRQGIEVALRAMWEAFFIECKNYQILGGCGIIYGPIETRACTFENCPLVGQTRKELDGGTPKGNVGDNPKTEVEK